MNALKEVLRNNYEQVVRVEFTGSELVSLVCTYMHTVVYLYKLGDKSPAGGRKEKIDPEHPTEEMSAVLS